MFNKMKEWNENRKLDREMKRMMRNQFSDYLIAGTEAKKAEKDAYESMTIFSETFTPENLQEVFSDIHTVVSDPKLNSDYYTSVLDKAHKQKMTELEAVK